MTRMKIALCVSGQPRGLPLCLDFLQKNIIEPNHIQDVFFHAWHDEASVGQPYNSANPVGNPCYGFVKPHTEQILVNTLQPKKFLINPQMEFPHLRSLIKEPTANQELLGSNFCSVFKANTLKCSYEQEQEFVYDCVIRTRYDLVYNHPIIVQQYAQQILDDKIVVMERFQQDQDNLNNPNKPMVDIFAFGSSKSMDVFSSVYPNMVDLNQQISPRYGENYLGQHVRVNNNVDVYKAPLDLVIMNRVMDLRYL